MSKTIIVGDIHLGKGQSIGKSTIDGTLNSRVADQFKILYWITDTALLHNVDKIILLGDIFQEVKPDIPLISNFIEWLRHCYAYGIEIYIITGNHDVKRIGNKYISVLDIIVSADLEGVYVYNKLHTLNTDGVSFTFLPFRDKRSFEVNTIKEAIDLLSEKIPYSLADIPYNNIKVMVGHMAIEGSIYADEVDNLSNEIMLPLSFFNGYDYVWMGHVHTPQVFNKSNPFIAHVGSMDLSDFGETKQVKNIVLFDSESDDKFLNINVPSRPLRRVRLDIPKDEDPTEYLINNIKKQSKVEGFENSIVKLEINLDDIGQEIDRKRINEVLSELKIYHISSFSESKKTSVLVQEDKQVELTIEPKTAAKAWIDSQDLDDEDKCMLTDFCIEVIDFK